MPAIVNLSYEPTNLMSCERLCNFREAYIWNCYRAREIVKSEQDYALDGLS
jgi:hypothetical protein